MAYTVDKPQTLEEFLAKYASAIDKDGKFIQGKANLNYDDMDAAEVYRQVIGGYTMPGWSDDNGFTGAGTEIPKAAEVNADWIEDPRAKGWIAQHPTGAALTALMLGGVGANAFGLLGGGSAGAAGSAGGFGAGGASGTLGSAYVPSAAAFGGSTPAWMTGANAVGAGDLALASMPEITSGMLGTGTAAGLGTTGAAALETFPQVTVTGSKGAGSAFGGSSPSWMTGASTVGAGDLNKVPMPSLPSSVSGGGVLDTAGQFLKDNPTLAKLGGAALGGLLGGQDSTVSSSKDPWAPAQPYLKANLERNQKMQDYYAKNPFSTEQKAAYQGYFDTLANNQANAPVMSGIANSFMGSNRGLLNGMPQFTQGTKAPLIDWTKYANIGMGG